MSEKIFTVTDAKNHNSYRLTVAYNSFTIEFIVENSTYIKEKYESGNMNLPFFHQKNKIFKQFENILKIAEVIRSKIDKKQFSLELPFLILKFRDEYDNPENIQFELKASSSGGSQPGKVESAKSKIENLDKITKKSNAPTAPPKPAESFKPQKPTPPPTSNQPPKQTPPPPKPAPSPSNPPSSAPIQIVGSYVPPSLDTKGTIFERINKCKALKKDMKKTLEDINNRLLDVKKRIDNFVDKAFANNPTPEDRKKALNLITEVMMLRQGFKDIDNYHEIFQNEVKQKHITFNAADKEQFEDDMLILGKAFPYSLTPFHQKIDHLFIQVQHNFFKEKNLRFYKERELTEVLKLKEKLFNKL